MGSGRCPITQPRKEWPVVATGWPAFGGWRVGDSGWRNESMREKIAHVQYEMYMGNKDLSRCVLRPYGRTCAISVC